jgi:protein arginine kinase activator
MKDLARCDCCGAPATVFLTQVVDGVATHLCLCDKCARDRGFSEATGMPPKGLAGFWDFRTRGAVDKGGDLACPKCGTTVAKLCATSRVGCAQCYSAFCNIIFEKVSSRGGGGQFAGKIPTLLPESTTAQPIPGPADGKRGPRSSIDGHVRKLFHNLRIAIVEERYEDAARIRDEIVTCSKKKYEFAAGQNQKNA